MTHYPEDNYPAFKTAIEQLRAAGCEVHSPHEITFEGSDKLTGEEKWQAFMRADLVLLLKCKSMVMLPGWQCSRGANLEAHISHALKMPVIPYEVIQASVDEAAPPAASMDA